MWLPCGARKNRQLVGVVTCGAWKNRQLVGVVKCGNVFFLFFFLQTSQHLKEVLIFVHTYLNKR